MGNFTTKASLQKNGEHSLRKFGIGMRNERDEKHAHFEVNHRIFVVDTYFQKKTTKTGPGKIKSDRQNNFYICNGYK